MKCNNENHKHEQDEWNCPLTPLDIAIRQSPSYLSQAPKEDILTKKINTQPPRHEFWQSRISTALMSVISLSAVIGSVSAYLYFKFVPIIENPQILIDLFQNMKNMLYKILGNTNCKEKQFHQITHYYEKKQI